MKAVPAPRAGDSIPALPAEWLESLQAEQWAARNVNNYASRADLQEWLESRTAANGDPCSLMDKHIDLSVEEIEREESGAHDTMNRRVFLLLSYAFEGHRGIIGALDEVKNKFVETVHDARLAGRKTGEDPAGNVRGEAEAFEEYLRSRDGAIRILMASEEDSGEPFSSCYCLLEPERPDDEHAPGFHAEYKDPALYRDSDLGLASHFFDLHKWDFCWLTEEEQWILWTGTTWQRDADLQIHRMAWDVGERMAESVMTMGEAIDRMERAGADAEEIKKVEAQLKSMAGKAKEAHQLPRVKRLVETSRALPNVARSLSAFDTDPRALGVGNGVLILGEDGTVTLRAGTRADRITRSTRVDYVPGARHKELAKFLRTFVPDAEVARYLQKFLGYSMLGKNEDRKIAFFIGASSSGKSTLLEAVIAMMGEYGGPLPLTIFHANNTDKPRPDIIAAKPRRIVATSELDAKSPIHADQLKKLVSTDSVSVRAMHKDRFDDREHAFTPFIASNVTPSVPGADTGFRQRLAVFPFNHSLVGTGKIDPRAGERFRSDPEILTALLAWMVEGYEMYAAEGLDADVPKAMQLEADKFMAGTNHFQLWFMETFVRDANAWEATESIAESYTLWCDSNAVSPSERLALGRALPAALEDSGFRKGKVRKLRAGTTRTREGFRFRKPSEARHDLQ